MMLAQTEIPPDWFSWADRGLAVSIVLVLLWLALRYVPRLTESHIDLVTTLKENVVHQKQCNDTQKEFNEAVSSRLVGDDQGHAKTHKTLTHIVSAAKALAPTPEAQRHLDRAHDELRD